MGKGGNLSISDMIVVDDDCFGGGDDVVGNEVEEDVAADIKSENALSLINDGLLFDDIVSSDDEVSNSLKERPSSSLLSVSLSLMPS